MRRLLFHYLWVIVLSPLGLFAQQSPKQNAKVLTTFQVAGYKVQSTFSLRVPRQYHWNWPSNIGTYEFLGSWNTQTTTGWSYSGPTHVLLTPGVMYELGLGGWYDYSEVKVNVPAGYRVLINDQPTNVIRTPGNAGGGFGSYIVTMLIVPENDSSNLPAGMALPPRVGDLIWSISAGTYANGLSAGSVQWRTGSFSSALLNPTALDYAAPASVEVSLAPRHSDGGLMELRTFQFLLYVRRNSTSGTGYDIEIYSPYVQRTSGTGDGPFTYSESPYRTYSISNPDGSTWNGRIRIEKYEPALTETWMIEKTATDWIITETNSLRTTTRHSNTTYPRVETVEVKNNGTPSVVSTRLQNTYQIKPWFNQEELTQVIANPTNENGTAITTNYEYYETPGTGGYGRLKSVSQVESEYWERYEYDNTPTGCGNLTAILRPWQDSTGVTAATATTSNCNATLLSYASELGNLLTLPAGYETWILGSKAAQTSVSYSFPGNGSNGEPVCTQTIQNYTSSGTPLTTTLQLYHPSLASAHFLGRPRWVQAPDGTKVFALRYKGQIQDFGDSGVWVKKSTPALNVFWGEYRFHGFSTPVAESVAVSSFDGEPMDNFYMVPGRSIVEIYTYDDQGNVRYSVKCVFTGASGGVPTFDCVERDTLGYFQGMLGNISKLNGYQEILWSPGNGLISGHTANDGVYRGFGYDALKRQVLASKDAIASSGDYPAHAAFYTHRTFDTSDRVVSETVTPSISNSPTPEAVTTARVYNPAGQLRSVTAESGAGNFQTNYFYTNGGRTVETRLPGPQSGLGLRNRMMDRYRDGSIKSVTGSAVVASYTKVELSTQPGESGFLQTTTYTGSNNGPRWTRVTTDWAGRVVREERPALSGVSASTFTKAYFYDDAASAGAKTKGKLIKTTETGIAPTLYEYNDWRQQHRTGLKLSTGPNLTDNSADRITETDVFFEKDGSNAWWLKSTTKSYKDLSGNTTAPTSTKIRLNKYDEHGRYFGSFVQSETHVTDIFGNTTKKTVAVQRGSSYHYTDLKLVTETIDHADSTTDEVTVVRHGLLQKKQTKGGLIYRTYYDSRSRPIKTTDPRTDPLSPFVSGGAARLGYVANSDRIAWRQDSAGKETNYGYESDTARLATETLPSPGASLPRPVTRYGYDTLDRVLRMWGSGVYPVQYAYNAYGERASMTTYQAGDPSSVWNAGTWPSTPPTGHTTTWNHDASTGLLLNKVDAAANEVNYAYTPRGQISFREWARPISSSVATKLKTSYLYDNNTGELTNVDYNDHGISGVTPTPNLAFTYNRLGHQITAAQVGVRSTTYDLCDCGKPHAEILDSTYFGGRRIDYDLHALADGTKGRTMGYTLRQGSVIEQTIAYGYTAQSRLSSVTVDGAAFTYGYLEDSPLVNSITQAGANWTQARTYLGARNLFDAIETKIGAVTKAKFDYDPTGNGSGYDALGRRTTVAKTGEMFVRYGTGGLDTFWGYNDRSELTSEVTKLGGDPTVLTGRNDTYAYDNMGNRAATAGTTHNGPAAGYTTNSLNQYTQRVVPTNIDVTGFAPAAATVEVNSSSTGVTRHNDYYFKGFSVTSTPPTWQSLTMRNSLGGSPNGPDIERKAFLSLSPEPFIYDADGNLSRDGRWVYVYDAENRLIAQFTRGAPADDPLHSVTANAAVWTSGVPRQKLLFTYDHLGRRISKLVANWNATTSVWDPALSRKFVYDGWNLIAELNALSGNSIIRTFAWGLDLSGSRQGAGGVGGLLAIKEGGNTYLPMTDGNGNVHGMVTAASVTLGSVTYGAGSIVAAYEYDAFGQTLRESGPYAANNPIRFSSKYTDTETGQVYYGYRFYSPSLGRFLNRDPISEQGGLNLYGFVGNNAVNQWDLLGLFYIENCRTDSYMVCYGSYCQVKADIICTPQWIPDASPPPTSAPPPVTVGSGGASTGRTNTGGNNNPGNTNNNPEDDAEEEEDPNNELEKKKADCAKILDQIKAANAKHKSFADQLTRVGEYRDRYVGTLDANNFSDALRGFRSELVDVGLNMLPGDAGALVGVTKYLAYDAPTNLYEGTAGLIQGDRGTAIQNYAGAGLGFTTSVIQGGRYTLLGASSATVGWAVAGGAVVIKGYQELTPYFVENNLRRQTLNQIDSEMGFLSRQAQDVSAYEGLLGQQWADRGCNDL